MSTNDEKNDDKNQDKNQSGSNVGDVREVKIKVDNSGTEAILKRLTEQEQKAKDLQTELENERNKTLNL